MAVWRAFVEANVRLHGLNGPESFYERGLKQLVPERFAEHISNWIADLAWRC